MEGCKLSFPVPSFVVKNCSIKEICERLSSQLTSYLFKVYMPGNIHRLINGKPLKGASPYAAATQTYLHYHLMLPSLAKQHVLAPHPILSLLQCSGLTYSPPAGAGRSEDLAERDETAHGGPCHQEGEAGCTICPGAPSLRLQQQEGTSSRRCL